MAGADERRFGLLGRTLAHSWSPAIHARLGCAPYGLFEREPQDVADFVRNGGWRGLNVTIPYKRCAFELADETSARARRLGVANTLVRRDDGSILADNTDLAGFAWMLDAFCRRELGGAAARVLDGACVLVLGSGGASKAVVAALTDVGARACVISRSGADGYEGLAERHADARLVVNTTPVGMFPACPASPLTEGQLESLTGLKGVLDVVYNPLRTGICLASEGAHVPAESGLAMLVAQAALSAELFLGRAVGDEAIADTLAWLGRTSANVLLIGMPGVGKTSAGRALARLVGRPFVDLDDAVDLQCGMSAREFLSRHGEDAFRRAETKVAAEHGRRSGLVVACGGGIVTRPENYPLLHQNGTIVLLRRPLSQLSLAGRPLSQARGLEQLERERGGLYASWADLTLDCTGSAGSDARALRRLLSL